jgi:hypothetical protein
MLASHQARRALESACSALTQENVTIVPLSDLRAAAVISNCERRAALAVARRAIAEHSSGTATYSALDEGAMTLSIGVATASVVPRNFDPQRMIERANRCLSAAQSCGISAVKSIEV